jgi:hypothetical protein
MIRPLSYFFTAITESYEMLIWLRWFYC